MLALPSPHSRSSKALDSLSALVGEVVTQLGALLLSSVGPMGWARALVPGASFAGLTRAWALSLPDRQIWRNQQIANTPGAWRRGVLIPPSWTINIL